MSHAKTEEELVVLTRARKRVDQLLAQLTAIDPAAGEHAEEAVRLLVGLYGAGLQRIVEAVTAAESTGPTLLLRMLDDELVAGLLILHDLHPQDTIVRVEQALDTVRPYLGAHSGDVELLGVHGGTVRLRLQGACDGCPSSAATVKRAIERAIAEAAPEITDVDLEGASGAEPAPEPGLLPLESLRPHPHEHMMTCPVPRELTGAGGGGAHRAHSS